MNPCAVCGKNAKHASARLTQQVFLCGVHLRQLTQHFRQYASRGAAAKVDPDKAYEEWFTALKAKAKQKAEGTSSGWKGKSIRLKTRLLQLRAGDRENILPLARLATEVARLYKKDGVGAPFIDWYKDAEKMNAWRVKDLEFEVKRFQDIYALGLQMLHLSNLTPAQFDWRPTTTIPEDFYAK
jgi:hypothetical protein